jgi:subtilisin family serine protease
MSDKIYTYQGGKRLELAQSTTRFVSRAKKVDLVANNFNPLHLISPHSWCVETAAERLWEDLARARRIAPAYPTYSVADSGAPFRVTDRIIVRFGRKTSETDAQQFAVRFGLKFLKQLSPRDYILAVPATEDVIDVVRKLTESRIDDVEQIDHDLNFRPRLQGVPEAESDGGFPQWQLLSDSPDPRVRKCALLDCERAWRLLDGYGDPDVVIAIVDSGCDLSDRNFKPGKFIDWALLKNGKVRSRTDYSGPTSERLMKPPRIHGTQCATVAAASVNGFGGIGVAPDCSLLPVKWQELSGAVTLSETLFAEIIDYLRNRVDVVSNSWSRGANGFWPPYVVEKLTDAALYGGRHGNGIVWVWAAGNRNIPIDHAGSISIPIVVEGMGALTVKESSPKFLNSFANLPGVMHVGAISSRGQRCHYSNYGKGLDVVAPSGNHQYYGRGPVDGLDLLAPVGKGFKPFTGTSAAAPQVAGVAALVRSANPQLTSVEVVSLLRRMADRGLDMSGYARSGRPIDPNPFWDVSPVPPFDSGAFGPKLHPDGPWSPWFGFGKVNAGRAVAAALRRRK